MVTKAEDPPKGPTKKARADAAMRTVIAGDDRGAVRRIVLYLVLFAGIGVESMTWTPFSVVALVVALIAAVLLIATDRLL